MWEKLNIFGWTKPKTTPQPVQRDISISITSGDRTETVQRSPSGTKIVPSSSTTKHRLDDDDSSDGSTSINFGLKVGPSPRRTSSFSFSREPLDLPTWSNVTSPGFTSRLVQQASSHSPLKEFNDSLSHSPFRKSPHKNLGLGELPFVKLSSIGSSPAAFPFPSPNGALRSGVTSSIYNRDRRKNARQGQVFVRIAPIDPTIKSNLAINVKSSGGSVSNSPFPPRGSPRTGNESYRQEGLGGIPQQEFAMRFNRMWPASPGSPTPGPGRPLSPGASANIMEAMAGRKRVREQEPFYPPNATPPSVPPPSKISIGIGDTPVRPHQLSKRVKFIGGHEGHDRPMMVPYSGIGGGDHEHLSSESILEQMNQTEKRFLPDSTSTPYTMHKKAIRMSDEPCTSSSVGCGVSSSHSGTSIRKRRSQSNIMNPGEEEAKGEKFARYCCTCNDCYEEAAGNVSLSQSSTFREGSTSPNKSSAGNANANDTFSSSKDTSSLRLGLGINKKTCDIGVGTDYDRAAYFKELFRKADKKKKEEQEKDEVLKYGKTLLTKEMHDMDKKKRVERYFRILKMTPPGTEGEGPSTESNAPVASSSTSVSVANGVSNGSYTSKPTDGQASGSGSSAAAPSGFNFGSPAPAPVPGTSTSFGFGGKQTSPIALTVTTSACPTITSPSITGTMFGAGLASTAPSTSATVGSFGAGLTQTSALTGTSTVSSNLFGANSNSSTSTIPGTQGSSSTGSGTTPATLPTFSSPAKGEAVPSPINFGTGSNPIALPKPNDTPAPVVTSTSTGFSFSATSTPPTFGGFGSLTSTSASTSQPSTSTVSTSGTGPGAVALPPPPAYGAEKSGNNDAAKLSSGFSFGQTAAAAPSSTQAAQNNQLASGGLFGLGGSGSTTKTTVSAQPTTTSPPATFSFGQSTTNTSTTQPTQDKQSSGAGLFQLGQQNKLAQSTGSTNAPSAPGFSFGQQATQGASSGGFSFGGVRSTPGAEDKADGKSTSASSGSAVAPVNFSFGKAAEGTSAVTSATTTSTNIFGAATTAINTPFGTISSPATATTSGLSQGAGAGGGSIFGGLSGNVSTTSATATASTSSAGSIFGMPSNSSTTTASLNPAGSTVAVPSFGSNSAFPSGGISFGSGGQSNKANETQPASSTGSGGFNFSSGGNTNPPAFGGFGGTSSTPSTQAQTSTSANTFGSFGRPSFPSVPNPLANTNKSASTGATSPFGGFGSAPNPAPAATSPSPAVPPFGSFGGAASPPSVFGGGGGAASTGNNNPGSSSGFSFGQSAMSPPQPTQQPTQSGFAFGGGGAQSQSNPLQSPPAPQQQQPAQAGFSFGQGSAMAAPVPQPSPGQIFQFGQQPQQPAGAGAFQFGQQAAQAVPGGFNFGAATPVAGQPMFSVGTASTAPRRRDARRRHR